MSRKLLYLVNPISGIRKKPLLKATIEKETEKAGFAFSIEDTRADGNYSWLRTKIIEENITDIIVCGGDGSVSTVTSYLSDIPVNIGIIPMGSGNGLALAAGIPASALKALEIIFRGRSSFIDGFLINDKFSCMMCGIGADAQVAHDFAVEKTRGLKTYLKLSALHYFKSKPFLFRLQSGNFSMNTRAFFVIVANSNQFGNNVTIAPRASLSDGLLDIVVVKKMHKLILPFALLRQITGLRSKNVVYFQSPELVIENKEGAPLHIDGEPEPPAAIIKIRIKPRAFRLLQP